MSCNNSNCSKDSINDDNDDNIILKLESRVTTTTTRIYINTIMNHKMILFRYIILFYIHLCCFIILQRIINNNSPTTTKINEILYKVWTTNSWLQRNHHDHHRDQQRRLLKVRDSSSSNNNKNNNDQRILYIITTLAEYNTGDRATIRGSDRLQETTIPIIIESITSMILNGYNNIDLYIVAHYTLTNDREQLIHNALKEQIYNIYHIKIGFHIWYDATPLGYDTSKKPNFIKLEYRTLHLAREHRFIIKDKIASYDIFVNFEDDMYISGQHIQHYVAISNELNRLYEEAPTTIDYKTLYNITSTKYINNHYYGPMTKLQLRRMIPGFMRTEVLLDETKYSAQTDTGPIPIDMIYNDDDDDGTNNNIRKQQIPFEVNSTICCHVSKHIANENRPIQPTSTQLMIWETNIFPLGIRRMPINSWLKWVVLQRGPSQNDIKDSNGLIGDYWTNRDLKYYPTKKSRPSPQEFKYINNQGGWMSIQKQLLLWHTDICLGSFLPPYDVPHYQYDGLDMRNVEWYSGGMQLSTSRHACNMQRIIQLSPNNFSKSLLYHTANNKQRQLSHKREEFFTKANTLLGQLNTIKKNAILEIP